MDMKKGLLAPVGLTTPDLCTLVQAGQTGTLSKTGGDQGDYIAELRINDIAEQSEKLNLPPGVNYNLAFEVIKSDPGTYNVSIGDLSGKFIVQEPIKTIPLTAPSDTASKRTSPRPSSCCGGGTTGGTCP